MRLDLDPDAPLCSSGKRPLRTADDARKELGKARHLRAVNHNGYRPGDVEEGFYECPVCHWFHLTSSTRARRRSELGNRGRKQRR